MSQQLDLGNGSMEALLGQVADEFTDRLNRGERPDVEDYARRYPEMAAILRQVLPALQVMGPCAPSADPSGVQAGGEALVSGCLGDFRLIREAGRGGMGIVYEAVQVSLGRRVALKVLPFAATMDPRHLQLFHNEARAAASLHHEHIVPVYAVGCEHAVHFYAMQFIDGKSLAELIAAQGQLPALHRGADAPRSPASATEPAAAVATTPTAPHDTAHYRRIAGWGTQAAEALEHAHSLGIVHRDVKPANLIVDVQGKLWVTDFGLARTVTDAGLTMSGDLLGTLRYMSPEQALAKHGLVDHRTDVYSLGATLYELLTGRPVIDGQDRQEILRRIAEEEPPPPRAIERQLPADLETVVLKALAREPAERYATAKELADDLGRFLEGKPICAKRPALRQRVRRWGQRHRHLLGAAAVCLVLGIAALAVSTFLLWREEEQTRKALAEVRASHAQAEEQRRRAETNFREAYWTVEEMLCAFDPARNPQPLSLAELRKWQTTRALLFLAPFCEDPSEEPAARLQKGVAYVTKGRVLGARGEHEQAHAAYHQAAAVFDRLAQDFPDDPTYPHELAAALDIIASGLYDAGRIADARGYCRQEVTVLREAIRRNPADRGARLRLAYSRCVWADRSLRMGKGVSFLFEKEADPFFGDRSDWTVAPGIVYPVNPFIAPPGSVYQNRDMNGSAPAQALDWPGDGETRFVSPPGETNRPADPGSPGQNRQGHPAGESRFEKGGGGYIMTAPAVGSSGSRFHHNKD